MNGERGASRWTVGALVAVLILTIAGLAIALGWFAEDDDHGGAGTLAVAESTTTGPATTDPTTTSAAASPATTSGDEPLCELHADLTEAVQGHLPVEGPGDLEAFNTAQIEFHEAAVGVLDPPERDAFASLLAWHEDLAVYYEALEWDPSPGLDVLVENPPPQPPADAVAVVARTLEERCGVVPIQDQTAP